MNRKLITDMDTDENDDLSAVNTITLKSIIQMLVLIHTKF